MKLRTQFILMVIGIIAIPLLSIGVFTAIETFSMAGLSKAPSYQQLADWIGANTLQGLSGSDPTHLVAGVKLRNFMLNRPLESELVLLDKRQEVLFSTIPEFVTGQILDDIFLIQYVRRNLQALHFQFELPHDLANTGLLVMVTTPRQSEPLDATLRRLLTWVMLLGIIFFAATVSVFMLRSLTKSITNLELATRHMAEGDMDGDIPLRGPHEIKSLTKSFNAMRSGFRDEFARRTRFVMGLSHDLKTPLTLIKGYVEAIQDGFYPDTASQANALGIIHDKTGQLEEMISDLINLAKLETTAWQQKLEASDMHGLLEDICQQYRIDAPVYQRQFNSHLSLPRPLMVRMDSVLVRHALENLLANAFRYTAKDGQVTLKAIYLPPKHLLQIEVSDNGSGIPLTDQAKIFDLFFRGSNSRQEGGHGLGLAMVKSVAESHGWRLAMESIPGEGTSFRLAIPIVG